MSNLKLDSSILGRDVAADIEYMVLNDAEDIVSPLVDKIARPVKTDLDPIGSRERANYGLELRKGALRNVKLADRLDPEHICIFLLKEKDMAVLREQVSRISKIISHKNSQIGMLTAALKMKNDAEMVSSKDHAAFREQALKTIEELTSSNQELTETIRSITEIIGDIPDASDKSALAGLNQLLTTEEHESVVLIKGPATV
jgi:hypothetical protein